MTDERNDRAVVAADDVTDEVLAAAEETETWYGDGPIDWDDFWDRLDGTQLADGSEIDLSPNNEGDSPAMRKIQRHIRNLRRTS
jgi:hypothetical protein